jgi:tape measure domain-containing protein
MADFANLVLGVDTSGLKRGERALNDTTRAGGRTEQAVKGTGRGFDSAGRSASTATPKVAGFGAATDTTGRAVMAATRALALFGGAFVAVREISQASQAFANMSNSMRVLGFEAEDVAIQINAIGDIANRTRAPLAATAQLYQRISIAANDLGASQQQVLRFTENVGLALAQQGGSAEQASGALLQLSQAMSGGTVRAEEFNSILEGAFPIAQAAANAIEGAAGSVGQLRNMVIAGEVSSREFFDAILSSSDALEVAFGKTVPTVSQAMTVLSTNFTLFIGQADNLLGISGALAGVIIALANNLDLLASVAVVGATAFGVRYVGAMIAARVATFSLTGALAGLKAALISTGIGALVVGAGVLLGLFSRLVTAAGGFGVALGLLRDVALGVWDKIKTGGEVLLLGLQISFNNINNSFIEMLGAMSQNWARFSDGIAETSIGELMGLEGGNSQAVQSQYATILNELADANFELTGSMADARGRMSETTAGMDELRAAMAAANEETANGVTETAALAAQLEGITDSINGSGGASGAVTQLGDDLDDAADSATSFASTFQDGITDALDYVLDGMKSGMDGLMDIFKRTLMDMIKFALTNPINLQGGMNMGGGGMMSSLMGGGGGGGGGISGGLMAGISAGAVGGGVAGMTGLAALGAGAGAAGSAFLTGGTSMMTAAIGGQVAAAGAAGAGMGAAMAAVGAVALPLLAIAAVVMFFKSKTKVIDSGIRATIDMEDAMFESFKEIEKSRFFGLSKKRSTSFKALTGDNSAPLDAAVFAVRESVIGATESLGVSIDVFNGFTHDFTLSLKGLDEAARTAAITEEFARMGDSMAGLVPHIADMNHLFQVAANRVGLMDRLLQAQANTEELTARIRGREMDATNELNKALLAQVFAAEDAAAAVNKLTASFSENAFATGVDFRRGLSRASNGIETTPQQSQAEMLAELKALNARIDVLQSTSEITANSSSQTAENTDYSNALTLDAAT